MTFGGFNANGNLTDFVYLVDEKTKQSCLHSNLPVAMKDPHIFEFNNTLLVCSSDSTKFQCVIWFEEKWTLFSTPEESGLINFISAVRVPNIGIWFMDGKNGASLILKDKGEWVTAPEWTHKRTKACSIMISNTKVAHIGGQKSKNSAIIGNTIDIFDFSNTTSPVESINITQMAYKRKQFSCALIQNGQDGNPTVAICKFFSTTINITNFFKKTRFYSSG